MRFKGATRQAPDLYTVGLLALRESDFSFESLLEIVWRHIAAYNYVG